MKAVVVSIKGNHVAILRSDGQIIKTRNRNYTLGDEIQDLALNSLKFKIASVAAALFITLASTSAWAYATPYYYVSVDVNPSVTMSVNRFDRVIQVESKDDDLLNLQETLQLKNQNINTAVANLVNHIEATGYIESESEVVIAVASNNTTKGVEIAEKLEKQTFESFDTALNVHVTSDVIGVDMVDEARKMDITPGRYNVIVNKLGESPEALKDQNMGTLMKRYKQSKDKELPEETHEIETTESTSTEATTERMNKTPNKGDENSNKPDKDNKGNNSGKKNR